MCPHSCHHSGSMATPALGTRDVRLYIYTHTNPRGILISDHLQSPDWQPIYLWCDV